MNKIIDQQLNKNDCGISVIKTICNIHNFNISRNYISKKIFLDERGANISEIKGFFEELGFLLDYKLLDLNYINENLTYFDNLFPFVIPVERKDELHYLVVNGIKKNKLIVYDSSIFQTKYLSIQEIKRQAHFTNSY